MRTQSPCRIVLQPTPCLNLSLFSPPPLANQKGLLGPCAPRHDMITPPQNNKFYTFCCIRNSAAKAVLYEIGYPVTIQILGTVYITLPPTDWSGSVLARSTNGTVFGVA